jgi:magnesium transporter
MEKKVLLRDLMRKPPADIAEVLSHLSDEEASDLIHRLLLRHAAAEPLGEMEAEASAELLSEMSRDDAIKILSEMDPDDAVDVLGELPENVQTELLSRLAKKDADVLSELLAYPPDTAGGLMSPEVVALPVDMAVQEAIDFLRKKVEEVETIYYAYAVDKEGCLEGVFSLRDMALAKPNTPLSEILKRDAISVVVDEDVEDVAHLFDKYNFFALPVVDHHKKLLGVITIDDVIDVIREEATEDIYGMASVPLEEGVNTSLLDSLRMRLPWLSIRLATALLAAMVVGIFETAIARVAALAVLMGVVAGQGGSAGMQTVTIITRGMALGQLESQRGWHLLAKEVLLGVANGVFIGITIGAITYAWKGEIMLGVAACLAMILNMLVAGAAGVLIPVGLRTMGKDPALASGILLPTVTDVLGFAFLFLIAHLLLPGI